jgi:hypothetical protein
MQAGRSAFGKWRKDVAAGVLLFGSNAISNLLLLLLPAPLTPACRVGTRVSHASLQSSLSPSLSSEALTAALLARIWSWELWSNAVGAHADLQHYSRPASTQKLSTTRQQAATEDIQAPTLDQPVEGSTRQWAGWLPRSFTGEI